jgi:GNAT superfamily N-acetyltransferase
VGAHSFNATLCRTSLSLVTLLPGPGDGASAVTVWSLEMMAADQVRSGRTLDRAPTLRTTHADKARTSRDCYAAIGTPWHWVDRADWTFEQWQAWTDRPDHHLVTAWLDDALVGYYELEQQAGVVEIAYFGITPGAMGRGFGGWLLTETLQHAWRLPDTTRVWVHTCSLDAPAALANYEARGMNRFAERIEWRLVTPQ